MIFHLIDQTRRNNAKAAIDAAPDNYVCEIKERKRSALQNAKMHAMLADVAKAKPMGRDMTPDHWKGVFMDAIGKKPVWVPSLDGDSVLCLGYKSSHLRVAEMADLIEQIYSFGAENGVKWSEKYDEIY